MKWMLNHTPKWAMQYMVYCMSLLGKNLCVSLFLFMMPAVFKMTDEEMDVFLKKMVHGGIFHLPNQKRRDRFSMARLTMIQKLPERNAIHLVKHMAPFCKSGTLKEYTTEQATMQHNVSALPKEQQAIIIKVFTAAGATGFLPVNMTGVKMI